MKHQPSLVAAMTTPAIDGPSSRATLTIDELSAIALGRSALSSISSLRNACRPGMSNALTIPCATLSPRIHATVLCPLRASAASANDSIIDMTCVTTRRRRRSHRSTRMPANGPSRNAGNRVVAKPTRPSSIADPVSRYTSQLVAVVVIHVPASDTICPPKNRR